jgi:Zn ribbon nucleic-acid-binding protein
MPKGRGILGERSIMEISIKDKPETEVNFCPECSSRNIKLDRNDANNIVRVRCFECGYIGLICKTEK